MPAAALRPERNVTRVRAAARERWDADQARRLLAIAPAWDGRIEWQRPGSGQGTLTGCAIGCAAGELDRPGSKRRER